LLVESEIWALGKTKIWAARVASSVLFWVYFYVMTGAALLLGICKGRSTLPTDGGQRASWVCAAGVL
jgi:hypothetical protein